MKQIELTDLEQSVIQSALNAYWNDAHTQLYNNCKYALDGTKLPLGDIEKEMLENRKKLTLPILRRFENWY